MTKDVFMNICFVVNKQYVKIVAVVINSIFESCMRNDYLFYIVNSELDNSDLEYIKKAVGGHAKIIDIKVDSSIFDEAPLLRKDFSVEGYYKLLLPFVLPCEMEKALYLDCDIIVLKDICELYNSDIHGFCYAAVPDKMINCKMKSYVRSLGIETGEKYYNTGVLLLNLRKLREEYKIEDYVKYIVENGQSFKYHDQQVINYFNRGQIAELDKKYNYAATPYGIIDFFQHIINYKIPYIVHYSGVKPWYAYYYGFYYKLFWKYAKEYIELDSAHEGKHGYKVIKFLVSTFNTVRRK